MKRRFLCLVLTGSLALSLGACSAATEKIPPQADPTRTETVSPTPSPTLELPPEVRSNAADVPSGDYAPWQTAYAGFLAALVEREADTAARYEAQTEEEREADPSCWQQLCDASKRYGLYDVDEDGIPELFVEYGSCEADYHTVCYTLREGQVTAVGEFGSGHGGIYTCPGESAFLFRWGHMGYAEISRVPMENGELGEWERLLEEDTNPSANHGQARSYTDPAELVPGSEYVEVFSTSAWYWDPMWGEYGQNWPLILPVYEYGAAPREKAQPIEEEEVRTAMDRVFHGGAVIEGISGNHFYGATGPVTWKEYLAPGGAYPYNDDPLIPREAAFADANGDGQTDCIVRLGQTREGFSGTLYVVLALEEGRVYAYFLNDLYGEGAVVEPNGSVYFRQYSSSWKRLSFYQNQCYFYSQGEPVVGDGLAWDKFASNP